MKRGTQKAKQKILGELLAKLGLRGEDQDGAGSTNYSTWSIYIIGGTKI